MFKVMGGVRAASHVQGDGKGTRGLITVQGDGRWLGSSAIFKVIKGGEGPNPCSRCWGEGEGRQSCSR